jgi:threonine-phosphate decarboxylase
MRKGEPRLPLPDNQHGGNIHQIARELHLNPQTLLDFSSNINPLGMPASLKERFIENIDRLSCYPDPEYQTLRENIGEYLDIPDSQIIPGNGASEIIYLLLNTLKPKNLLLYAPTFSEYQKAVRLGKVTVHYYELPEVDGFSPDLTKLAEFIDKVDCLCLCNPNNPTSTLLSPAELTELLALAKHKKAALILDESFIELTTPGNSYSMAPWLKSYDNLFIIRSFTKILALPGLRLGYGLGPAPWIEKMAQHKIPWSVNALSCIIGDYLPEIPGFLAKTSQWLAAEAPWLFQELLTIPSLKPFPPQSNFILVKILSSGISAAELRDEMARHGILIRNAANFHSLNGQFFRVAIKDNRSNRRLIAALHAVLDSV